MKNQIFTLISFFFMLNYTSSQLSVLDPQQQWNWDQGSIKNLNIDLTTIGMYHQVEYTFDVFATNPDNFNNDQLEYIIDFSLDKEASVNDSWLWIEDYISKGVIYERNYGTEIYDGIVDRQQDPSILTKFNDTRYQLRIYPLHPDSTRKVKISYLAPIEMFNLEGIIDIPVEVFNQSGVEVENVTFVINNEAEWDIGDFDKDGIELISESSGIQTYRINKLSQYQSISVHLDRVDSSPFFKTFDDGEEQYYQLAIFPEEEATETIDHFLFVVDYDKTNTTSSKNEILTTLKSAIKAKLSDQDFFNIVYTDFNVEFAFEDWESATEENIEEAFLTLADMDETTSLRFSLASGLSFLSTYNYPTQCFVYSNDDSNGDPEIVLELVSDIQFILQDQEISLHTYDYADYNLNYFWHQGQSYYGNDYLYKRLNVILGGVYGDVSNGESLNQTLDEVIKSALPQSDIYDLEINLEDGFTYSDYTNFNGTYTKGESIVSVGKYFGDSDIVVLFSAILDDEFIQVNQQFTFDEFISDEKIKGIWVSNYLLDFEDENDDQTIDQVVEVSKESRVLSKRTVFLCLEPNFDPLGETTDNNGGTTSTEEKEILEDVEVAPNPFETQFELRFTLEKETSSEDIRIELLSTSGQKVKSKSVVNIQNGVFIVVIEVEENMLPGMYFLQIVTPDGIQTIKVMKI